MLLVQLVLRPLPAFRSVRRAGSSLLRRRAEFTGVSPVCELLRFNFLHFPPQPVLRTLSLAFWGDILELLELDKRPFHRALRAEY